MPLKKYFHGKGEKVMRSMKKQYGSKKGEEVFYATVNKMKKKSKDKKPKGGANPFFGNSLPFQLGEGKRWMNDSRSMGSSSFKKGKNK